MALSSAGTVSDMDPGGTKIPRVGINLSFYIRSLVPEAGGHLNKKDGLTRYGESHVKDKTS